MINTLCSLSEYDKYKCIYGIVDGSAYGSLIKKFLTKDWGNKIVFLGTPKSFEFLLLHIKDINSNLDIFDKYYNYCDLTKYKGLFLDTTAKYRDFISLERFYTQYLSDITKNTEFKYYKAKNKLQSIYLDRKYQNEVLDVLKDIVWRV